MPIPLSTLLTSLLWLVAGLTGLFTLLGFFSHVDWRIELFSHFRAQYAIISGLCMWLFFLGGFIPGILFSLVFLVINLSQLLPLYHHREFHGNPITSYRLFFANIYGPNTDYRRIQAAFEQAQPDIILLVEVRPNHLQALLPKLTNYPYQFTLPDEENFGMAIFSRLPLEHSEALDFDGTCTPVLITHLWLAGRQLTLICMHPYPPKSKAQAARRDRQFAQLAPFAAAQPVELLLVGDLNTTSWSHSFRELLFTSHLLDSQQGFGLQPSWPANYPLLAIPIDHALHTPGLHIHVRRLGARTGSDHLPIILDFSFIE